MKITDTSTRPCTDVLSDTLQIARSVYFELNAYWVGFSGTSLFVTYVTPRGEAWGVRFCKRF
jgi:hypothetical protein